MSFYARYNLIFVAVVISGYCCANPLNIIVSALRIGKLGLQTPRMLQSLYFSIESSACKGSRSITGATVAVCRRPHRFLEELPVLASYIVFVITAFATLVRQRGDFFLCIWLKKGDCIECPAKPWAIQCCVFKNLG